MAKEPKIRIPEEVTKGEVFQVKAMIPHPMDSGRKKDKVTGTLIPRLIINKFICEYNGRQVFSADLHTSMSANPYIGFFIRATESGEITFTWIDDNGESTTTSRNISVQ